MRIIKQNIALDKMKKYYGLCLLILTEILFILVVLLWGDKLYVQINDNLDSNVSLFKMYRDNNCWTDRTTPIPMLGGVGRDVLNCSYTLNYLIYWFFDTEIAYWLNYVVAIALSGSGFYCLGLSCRRVSGKNISSNLFCICGILYVFIGMWPSAIIGFSLISWWAFMVLEIYRTKRLWLSLFFIALEYNISGPLIGIFLLFYTFIFCVLASVRDKKFNKTVFGAFGIIIVIFMICNYNYFGLFNELQRGGTIKSLASSDGYVYNDSIWTCINNLMEIFLLQNNTALYHSGVCTLKYVALPVVLVFFILINLERKNMKVGKEFLIIYDLLIAALFINACGMAFDKCYIFRKLVPFFSGFSFARFMWLSPFIIMLGCLMVFHYLCDRRLWKSALVIIIAIPVSIMLDVDSAILTYNLLHVNYKENICHQSTWHQARWADYYAQDLFEKIKSDIGYEGEWAVAYGFEPAILQYNGFKTLDGYYSNYSTEYKVKWEEMITPVLMENPEALEYWHASNGHRAYIYSTRWLIPSYSIDYEEIGETDMLIYPEILEELGGEYVLSNVPIKNADELGFNYQGTWSDENTIYNISVYRVSR